MNKEKVQELTHLSAGLIILLQGFENLDKEEFKLAAAYFGLALLFMIVAGLHKSLKKRFLQADTALFLVEAIIIANMSWNFKARGQATYFYLLAASAFVILCVAIYSVERDKKRKRSRSKSGRRRHHRHSSGSHERRSESPGSIATETGN